MCIWLLLLNIRFVIFIYVTVCNSSFVSIFCLNGTVDTAIIHGLYMTNLFLTVLEARKATAKLLKSDVQVQTQVQCLRAHLLFSVSLHDRKGEGLYCTGTDLFQSPSS